MTTMQANAVIGKVGSLQVSTEGFYVAVKILDARNSYGSDQLLVEPLNGRGCAWVVAWRVKPGVEVAPGRVRLSA